MLYEVITEKLEIVEVDEVDTSRLRLRFRITSYNVCYTKLLRPRSPTMVSKPSGKRLTNSITLAF